MDIRSAELNEEAVLGILDREFARELEEAFETDLRRATELDADEWRDRSIASKALERAAGLFSEQY